MVKYQSPSLNTIFAALADPTRRAILTRLMQRDMTVTQLAGPFNISLPAITKHLKVLENAGMLMREKRGRVVLCRLTGHPMQVAAQWLLEYERFWRQKPGTLAARQPQSKAQQPSPPKKRLTTRRPISGVTSTRPGKAFSAREPKRGR